MLSKAQQRQAKKTAARQQREEELKRRTAEHKNRQGPPGNGSQERKVPPGPAGGLATAEAGGNGGNGRSIVASPPPESEHLIFTSTLVFLDPNRVRVEQNPRTTMNEDELQELTNSIADNGQNEPALVIPVTGDPNHEFEILKGHRRREACCRLKRKLMAVIGAEPGSAEARLTEMVLSNKFREDFVPIDIARLIQDYLNLGLNPQRIEKKLGINHQMFTRRLALLNLAPQIQAMMEAKVNERERLSPSIAYEISRLIRGRQMLALELVLKEGLTVQQARCYVRDLLDNERSIKSGETGYRPKRANKREEGPDAPRGNAPSDDRAVFVPRLDRTRSMIAEYADSSFSPKKFELMFAPVNPNDFRAVLACADSIVANMLVVIAKLKAARPDVESGTDWPKIFKAIFGKSWRQDLRKILEEPEDRH